MQVVNNKSLSRFELQLPDGEYAFMEYRWLKGNMVLMRTFVPAGARKQGIGGRLVAAAFQHARDKELKVVIYCPFVDKYVQQHTEYQDLIATNK
jgi:uncharacterized protein